MKDTIRLYIILLSILLYTSGCGGGSDSSSKTSYSASETSASFTSPSLSTEIDTPSLTGYFANSFIVNPLRDLGLGNGENVCFRIKSYDNTTESDFSYAICDQIENDHNLTLLWNDAIGNEVGYYVYFGLNKEDSTQFLADIMKS